MPQPTYSSANAYIGEQFFTMQFSVALDAVNPPPLGAFSVQVNGSTVSVTSLSVDSANKTVTLGLSASAFTSGDVIAFTYQDPTAGDDTNAIQGTDGVDAASFNTSVTVSIARPAPSAPSTPVLSNASDSGVLGDGITNVASPTLTGTAGVSALVKLYDTDGTTLLGSTTADGSGNWSITSSTLAEGTHTLKVTQTDTSNATSALSTGLTLQIDTQALAPTGLTLSAGSDSGTLGDHITNDISPTITGYSEANAVVRLYAEDGTTVLGTTTANNSGNWSITSSTLAEGAHTLTAKQTDVAGNVSVASSGLTLNIDTIAPTALALSRTTVPTSQATSGTVVAALQSNDSTAVTYAFATGNGTIDADNGRFSIAGSNLSAATNLAAGTYHIYVRATDAAGNSSNNIFTVTVQDGPTVASIVRAGPVSGVQASATSVDYTVTFSESVTGVDASDFILAATGNAMGTLSSVTGSGSTYTVTVNGLGGDGTLRLDLKSSGTGIQNGASIGLNGGYSAGQAYTLDHTAPAAPSAPMMSAASDTGVSNSDGITQNTTPVFTGTGEANATVRLYDSDGTTVLGTATVDGSGSWSITSSTLASGTHSLTAKLTDAAGNVSQASAPQVIVIDTSADAPAIPVLALASDSGVQGDNITNVNTPTLTGTAEANALVTLYDTDGITVLGMTVANNAGVWSIASSALSDAVHTLTVRQTDKAANTSSASGGLVLTVDTTIPAAPPLPLLSAASDSGTPGDGITAVIRPVITGTAAAHATVTLYDSDGTTVLGAAAADGSGNWSITSSALALGLHTLTVRQVNEAGSASAASASLSLNIVAPPVTPTEPTNPPTQHTVDGVLITQQSITLPGGGTGIQTVIPIVTDGRVDNSGDAAVADIPLATGTSGTLLLAKLAAGFGLTATGGASQPAGSSTEQLIQAILASTPGNTASDQDHLTGNGAAFLGKLSATTPLLVETIVPVSAGSTAPSGSLALTGTSTTDQHTALVIDASHLPAQSKLELNAVDFAAVIGSINVTGNTSGQVLTGDAASQQFTVKADSASSVFAGAGNDTLVVTAASSESISNTTASTLIHGGSGNDQAVFAGVSTDYDVQFHEGHVVVTAKAEPANQVVVINAESLAFSDTTLAVQVGEGQTTLAGLYQSILGRQADYQGFDYWASQAKNGASLGQIAISMLDSGESKGVQNVAFNGNASNDIEVLYQGMFGRQGDADGLAYWVNAMQQGMTLEQVAQSFATASEITVHQVSAQGWDFIV